jgi:hypothetical protein
MDFHLSVPVIFFVLDPSTLQAPVRFGTALSVSLLNPLSPFDSDPFDTPYPDTQYSYQVFC